jgi:hypothetical protein
MPAPLGTIEPHAGLLCTPPDGQLLYKIMTIENLLHSVVGSYLHFNRVDAYQDFPGADAHDGEQLPRDRVNNENARFEKDPGVSAADYYDQSRARTYACCFSLENSDLLWNSYANGSATGKVCVVFRFGRFRVVLNRTLQSGHAALDYNGVRCRQIFSPNYGLVDYVDWQEHSANTAHLANPIRYAYMKAKHFSDERELRITLSALGIGTFELNDGTTIDFPPSLQLHLDFRSAIEEGAVQQILLAREAQSDLLGQAQGRLRIVLNRE